MDCPHLATQFALLSVPGIDMHDVRLGQSMTLLAGLSFAVFVRGICLFWL